MKPKILICLALVLSGIDLASVMAKPPPPFPDMASLGFWDDYSIYTARIIQIGSSQRDLTCSVSETISALDPVKEQIVVTEFDTLPLDRPAVPTEEFGLEWPRDLRVGDGVVVFDPREALKNAPLMPFNTHRLRWFKKISSLTADPFVMALRKIAGVHTNQSLANLLRNANDQDDLVSRYCLNLLDLQPGIRTNSNDATKLKALRDDARRDARVRLLADKMARRLAGEPDRLEDEYSWLRTSIAKSKSEDRQYVRAFVDRLMVFSEHRKETISFLEDLGKNPGVTLNVRIAAIENLDNKELFSYDNPDRESQGIFDFGLSMLKDRTPLTRSIGSYLLNSICEGLDRDKRKAYAERAIAALKAAVAQERDLATLGSMQDDLENIQGLPR
jgi:hypothetical protein